MISLSHSRLLTTTDGRSYLIRPLSLCSWSVNVVPWLMTLLSVCRVLVPKELVGKQYHSYLSNVQWPLNYSLRIWRRLEIGGRSPYSSMQCYIPLFLQALWYKTQQVYKKSSSHKEKKNGNFDAILFISSATGLAQSVERLTAEREVTGSIPVAGPILRVLN